MTYRDYDPREFHGPLTDLPELLRLIALYYDRGWCLGTATNFSLRAAQGTAYLITRSGIDKGRIGAADFLWVDHTGRPLEPPDARPSAETALHIVIYQRDDSARAILHTHSRAATVLSLHHAPAGELVLQGYELQKGLRGITDHETALRIPIYPNSQQIPALAEDIGHALRDTPDAPPAFLLAGHGLYTWGSSLAQAHQHLEALEFLFDAHLTRVLYGAALGH